MKSAWNTLRDRRIFRYLFVGVITVIFEYSTFVVLNQLLHVNYKLSNVCSMIVAVLINFTLNKYFVFKIEPSSARSNTQIQFLRYIVLFLFNLMLSTFIIGLLVRTGLKTYIAKLVSICVITAWTYLIYKAVIFKGNTKKITGERDAKDANEDKEKVL